MFIGHSLGGLVIKQVSVNLARISFVLSSVQALVVADHGDTFKNIRLSTTGIIFLGTPHQGSDAAVYGVWLAQVARRDKTLLESLRKNDTFLYDIARDFEESYHNVDIVCFYENEHASYGPLQLQVS